MLCRLNEFSFAYFGNKILQKLYSDGIKISEELYEKIYNILKKYRLQIEENPFNQELFKKIYSEIKGLV